MCLQMINLEIMISTHATHKGGDKRNTSTLAGALQISTHATHKGGDEILQKLMTVAYIFQLTPPIRVATHYDVNSLYPYEIFQLTPPIRVATTPNKPEEIGTVISTHATHKGGDLELLKLQEQQSHFNSRHP